MFLDRDDTLNVNEGLPARAFPGTHGDLYLPEYVRLMPGALGACRSLRAAGFVLVVITNQGGVARGHCDLRAIDATNARLRDLLDEEGGGDLIEACYVGPHHPGGVAAHLRGEHPWRKPGPGMVLAAAAELGLDLGRSWMVGDKARDIEAAVGAGVSRERCLRVGEGPGCDAADLAEAAVRIVSATGPRVPRGGTRVELRAGRGEPLRDLGVRAMVEATARSIAERSGVELLGLGAEAWGVWAVLETGRLGALGFMAELRRVTNAWHAGRSGGEPLWPIGESEAGGEDGGPGFGDAGGGAGWG